LKRRFVVLLFLFLAVVVIVAFDKKEEKVDIALLRKSYEQDSRLWPMPFVDSGVRWVELGTLVSPPTVGKLDSVEQARQLLGKMLFFEPRLSATKQISCSSCHDPDLSWTDGRQKAIGHNHRVGRRNTMSLQNAWVQKELFWLGRVDNSGHGALQPLVDPFEMNTPIEVALEHINSLSGYAPFVYRAFAKSTLDEQSLGIALSSYIKSIASHRTRFDNFVDGRYRALSDEQVYGLHLFRTKARCINCHNGPFFTDFSYHNLGFSHFGSEKQDLGRYEVTGNPEDVGKFRTPSLRNAFRTGPWFHDGSFQDLFLVVNMYNAGMPQPRPRKGQEESPLFPKQDPLLKPLNLTIEERNAIVRFLEAISSVPMTVKRPNLPDLD
jgi:cytochrome c peroxidase